MCSHISSSTEISQIIPYLDFVIHPCPCDSMKNTLCGSLPTLMSLRFHNCFHQLTLSYKKGTNLSPFKLKRLAKGSGQIKKLNLIYGLCNRDNIILYHGNRLDESKISCLLSLHSSAIKIHEL